MDKKKILIIAAVILAAVIIYFAFIKKKKPAAPVLSNAGGGVLAVSTASFPLKKGSTGDEVMNVQKYLISKYGNVLPRFGADGVWADETDAAVKTYLKRDNISAAIYSEWGIANAGNPTAAFFGYKS